MQETWRVPFLIGGTARLAYGVGCIVAPQAMGGRLAPTVRGPDARMNLRGFGGAQSGIALYTLGTARTPEGAKDTLRLNALVDGFDALVSALEMRDRGGVDLVAAGGVFVNVAGLVCWSAAAALLRRG